MNETNHSNPEGKIANKSEQLRFDLRIIDTLLVNFRAIESHPHEDDKQALVEHLFRTKKIRSFLSDHGVTEHDTLPSIINKLEDVAVDLEREKNTFRPPEEKPEVSANDNEAVVRQEVMSVQEKLNKLYRLNNEAMDEEERIKSALAYLEVFAAARNGSERVEVARTPVGEVGVLFEEDVNDAELLHDAEEDIRETQKRLAKYAETLAPATNKAQGLLGKLFQPRAPKPKPEPESVIDSESIEGRKMRTEIALAEKIETVEALQIKFQRRQEEKHQALREPLLVSGIDAFEGTWSELLQMLRAGVNQAQESLDAKFASRQKEIDALEAERNTKENSAVAA